MAKKSCKVSVGPVLKGSIDPKYKYTVKITEQCDGSFTSTARLFKTNKKAKKFRRDFLKKSGV